MRQQQFTLTRRQPVHEANVVLTTVGFVLRRRLAVRISAHGTESFFA